MLLKDAIKPNLVQTLEGNPAILHGGPFANIAQGTNSIIATKMGMSHADYVVTEAGFGSDLGAEKFLNIKCGYGGLSPKTIVIVATIRALRHHGGVEKANINKPNAYAVKKGFANLEKHIENAKMYGIEPVVAINKFVTDSDEEVAVVKELTEKMGVKAVLSEGWEHGGKGTVELAKVVAEVVDNQTEKIKPLYNWDNSIKGKILEISEKTYGAREVKYLPAANKKIKQISELGLDKLPICMAKTQKSFSDDDKKIGRPEDFIITVRDVEIAAGAGFVIPITGKMMRMPGLPNIPAAEGMDIDNEGNISGLS